MPLVISVSVPRNDVLREWGQRVRVWLFVLAGVSVMLAGLGIFLWQSWKANIRNEMGMSHLNDELIRVNEMARLVTENSNDVFVVVSLPDLIIEYVSPSVERNWGWVREEFIGQPLGNILDGETAERVGEKIAGMMQEIGPAGTGGRHGKID
ncbi:MAG TPA: PAS domain-containing protein, partial [Treponemataceae bacterium]|nr:PAS domain-containing protein [Treponemataceae bacterium]